MGALIDEIKNDTIMKKIKAIIEKAKQRMTSYPYLRNKPNIIVRSMGSILRGTNPDIQLIMYMT